MYLISCGVCGIGWTFEKKAYAASATSDDDQESQIEFTDMDGKRTAHDSNDG